MDELDAVAARARRDLRDRVSAMDLAIPEPTVIQGRLHRRRTIRTAVVLSITAAVLAVPVLASSRGENSHQLAVESPTSQQPGTANSAGTTHTAVPTSSSEQVAVSFSCVERYGPETLAKRKFAFDGDVISVTSTDSARPGDALIEFAVRHWYRGGDEPRTTLRTITRTANSSTSVDAIPIMPGMRLLVAGNTDFAWPCGFTQVWTAEAAAVWEEVFRNG